jgi:hypothetical protein
MFDSWRGRESTTAVVTANRIGECNG